MPKDCGKGAAVGFLGGVCLNTMVLMVQVGFLDGGDRSKK